MSDTDKTLKRLELEMALQEMTSNLDVLLEMSAHMAKVKYQSFVALQDAGFTDQQALEIVKAEKSVFG